MLDLPEKEARYDEDQLTPSHSIPSTIHSSQVSGSQGHSFESGFSIHPIKTASKQSLSVNSRASQSKSPPKSMKSRFSLEKKEKEAENFKIERKLSKEESFELFGRLDQITEKRKERLKKTSPEIFSKFNFQSPNKEAFNSGRVQKTSLLKRQVNEDQAPAIFSSHFRLSSDSSKFSSPVKEVTFLLSPPKPVTSARKSKTKSFCLHSSNSPEKVISKIQKLVRNK